MEIFKSLSSIDDRINHLENCNCNSCEVLISEKNRLKNEIQILKNVFEIGVLASTIKDEEVLRELYYRYIDVNEIVASIQCNPATPKDVLINMLQITYDCQPELDEIIEVIDTINSEAYLRTVYELYGDRKEVVLKLIKNNATPNDIILLILKDIEDDKLIV